MPLTFEQLTRNVQEWAAARGIYAHSSARAQLLKAFSEMGELADAEIEDDGTAASAKRRVQGLSGRRFIG